MKPRFQFTVHGTPAGQGNLKGSKHGKLRHANGAELAEWRGKVRQAARDHIGGDDWRGVKGQPCMDCGSYPSQHVGVLGPVRLEAVVTVPRPKSVRAQWPVTRSSSDWDHYGRALSDAMTGVMYEDDSQIVDGRVVVTYPLIHPDALHVPGVLIRIWEVA